MIKVLFFARIRDQVGCAELDVELPDMVDNIDGLTGVIKAQGAAFEEALSDPNLLIAVNQEMAGGQTTVEDGDEIAYFPPVTGG
ncbi:MAG: molybdopterin converting factor subunit 1 [Pseudomonadales bacterium]|nr:molybdopterin converting factor subunit 1 [Pseudomonadales bacterium]